MTLSSQWCACQPVSGITESTWYKSCGPSLSEAVQTLQLITSKSPCLMKLSDRVAQAYPHHTGSETPSTWIRCREARSWHCRLPDCSGTGGVQRASGLGRAEPRGSVRRPRPGPCFARRACASWYSRDRALNCALCNWKFAHLTVQVGISKAFEGKQSSCRRHSFYDSRTAWQTVVLSVLSILGLCGKQSTCHCHCPYYSRTAWRSVANSRPVCRNAGCVAQRGPRHTPRTPRTTHHTPKGGNANCVAYDSRAVWQSVANSRQKMGSKVHKPTVGVGPLLQALPHFCKPCPLLQPGCNA